MNSKSVLGDAMPTGAKRIVWNALMIFGNRGFLVRIRLGDFMGKKCMVSQLVIVALVFLAILLITRIYFIPAKTSEGCLVMSQWIPINSCPTN